MPDFDIIGAGISGGKPSGLLMGLDPAYQGQQLALKQAQAFQNGLPVDPRTGQADYGAAANKLIQLGDYGNAQKLMSAGLQMDAIKSLGGPDPFAGPTPAGGQAAAAQGGPGAAAAGVAAPKGAPSDYFGRLAMVESGGNDNAPASGSSAFGRYRFTDSTWNGLAKQYPELGLTPDGRSDPGQQQRAVQALTNNNASALGQAGFEPSPGNLRLAHFAGAGGATAVLKADPNAPVSAVLGDAAVAANPFLKRMTAGGLIGWANSQMSGVDPSTIPGAAPRSQVAQAAPPPAATAQPTAPGAPVGDAAVMQARARLAAAANLDPSSLTPAQQQAAQARIDADQQTVDAYRQQQAQPGTAQPVRVAQNGASDAPQPSGQHPFAPPVQPAGGGAVPPGRQPPMVAAAPAAPPAGAPPQGGPPPGMLAAQQPVPVQPATAPAMPAPAGPRVQTAMQTALAADPTMGGLLSGQFVGNPSAAINYLRQRQAQYGAAGITAAADAFKARADNIEKTVERLDQMTPEQRNARDPAALSYEYNKGLQQQQQRLAADTDPSRIAFAQNQAAAGAQGKLDVESSPQALRLKGQEAEATAAGTQQGNNSPAAIGAAASRAAQVAEATGNGQALGKLPEQYAQAATAASKQNSVISDMLDTSSQFNMGANADREQALNAVMSDLGHRMGVDTSEIDGKVAGYQQYVKLAGNLTRQAMKDTGGRAGGIQEMQFISNTLPSPQTSPLGFKGVAAFLQGSNDYEIAKQQAADAYARGPGQGSLHGFESAFTQNVSPAATILHRLQQDQPEMFQQTVARLKGSPAGQAVLKKAAVGLQYLSGMGVGN